MSFRQQRGPHLLQQIDRSMLTWAVNTKSSTQTRYSGMVSPTVDLQASLKVSSVNLSMMLVLPTPREPIIIICSLKSAGLGGTFLRRDCAPKAGEEFADPPLPAALRAMSYLWSIRRYTFGTKKELNTKPYYSPSGLLNPTFCRLL